MSLKKLAARGVHPEESIPARLLNYKLEFAQRGPVFIEPAFASVTLVKGDD